ncbi:hypothetical protein [Fluviispira vulneris]|uniref:hypothetical protein n=1 Tax=Fluviispira vulneris TaxID=2763012 RepID=UPI0016455199|nr:hypothetical protein [Fluviispira vulneris]
MTDVFFFICFIFLLLSFFSIFGIIYPKLTLFKYLKSKKRKFFIYSFLIFSLAFLFLAPHAVDKNKVQNIDAKVDNSVKNNTDNIMLNETLVEKNTDNKALSSNENIANIDNVIDFNDFKKRYNEIAKSSKLLKTIDKLSIYPQEPNSKIFTKNVCCSIIFEFANDSSLNKIKVLAQRNEDYERSAKIVVNFTAAIYATDLNLEKKEAFEIYNELFEKTKLNKVNGVDLSYYSLNGINYEFYMKDSDVGLVIYKSKDKS